MPLFAFRERHAYVALFYLFSLPTLSTASPCFRFDIFHFAMPSFHYYRFDADIILLRLRFFSPFFSFILISPHDAFAD